MFKWLEKIYRKTKQEAVEEVFGMRTDAALYTPEPHPEPDQLLDGKAFSVNQFDCGPYYLTSGNRISAKVEWFRTDDGTTIDEWRSKPLVAGVDIPCMTVNSYTVCSFRDALGYINGVMLAVGEKKQD